MKAWKRYEQRLTAWLSRGKVVAIRESRWLRGEAVEDVSWGPLSIEAKTRKTIPKYVKEWLAQAKSNCQSRMPVVIWHENHMRMGDEVVLLRLSDLYTIIEEWWYREEADDVQLRG